MDKKEMEELIEDVDSLSPYHVFPDDNDYDTGFAMGYDFAISEVVEKLKQWFKAEMQL